MHRQLGIPCDEREDPYCTRPPGDKLYCHLARERGFDSIQIAQAHFNYRPEMIVCSGKCATAAVRARVQEVGPSRRARRFLPLRRRRLLWLCAVPKALAVAALQRL